MGFAEVLTLVFIILKIMGIIAWSWWLVLLPEIIAVGIYLFIWVAVLGGLGIMTTYLYKSTSKIT